MADDNVSIGLGEVQDDHDLLGGGRYDTGEAVEAVDYSMGISAGGLYGGTGAYGRVGGNDRSLNIKDNS